MKPRALVFVALVFFFMSCIPCMNFESCEGTISKEKSMPGSCTTFAVQKNGQILFGNNEDYENPLTYYWVIPSSEDGYGGIYLGYEYGRPQGGINEEGLAFDGLALDPPEPLNPHPEKPKPGRVFTAFLAQLMQQCANVDQAIQMMMQYNFGEIFGAQILFADATGDAAIIGPGPDGELAVTRKPAGDSYLLGTNFNVVQLQEHGFEIPCWRYSKATKLLDIINNKDDLTVDALFNILDKVHQEGRKNNTLYSNVFDLKNGIVYLTYWYQFTEVITLNVQEEVENRTNMGVPVNSSDKVRLMTLFSEKTISRAEKAFERYVNALRNVERIAWIWAGHATICAILMLIDLLRYREVPWYVKGIWLLISFFLGFGGLLVYWAAFKKLRTTSVSASIFTQALGSAVLSAVGVTFTFLWMMLAVFFIAQTANLGLFAIIVPLFVDLLLFRAPMMAFLSQQSIRKSLLKYLIPELISVVVMVICIIFLNQYIGDYFNQYARYIGSPADIFFWVQLMLFAGCGSIVLYFPHLLFIHFKIILWPKVVSAENISPETTQPVMLKV